MAIKRVSGKMGKWIHVDKALPDGNYTVVICLEYPNRTTEFGLGKLIKDSFKVTALAETQNADLNDPITQDSLNQHIRYWQKMENP